MILSQEAFTDKLHNLKDAQQKIADEIHEHLKSCPHPMSHLEIAHREDEWACQTWHEFFCGLCGQKYQSDPRKS